MREGFDRLGQVCFAAARPTRAVLIGLLIGTHLALVAALGPLVSAVTITVGVETQVGDASGLPDAPDAAGRPGGGGRGRAHVPAHPTAGRPPARLVGGSHLREAGRRHGRPGRSRDRLIAQASSGHFGPVRAQHWLDAAREAVRLFNDHPAVAFQELAEEVKTEARLLKTAEAELALHAKDRAKAYAGADPKGLARSLPGIGEVGAPNLVAALGRPGRFSNGRQVRSFCGLTPR